MSRESALCNASGQVLTGRGQVPASGYVTQALAKIDVLRYLTGHYNLKLSLAGLRNY
ncbi:hypothetical protein FQZ97_1108480 [compost metagenome]